MTKTNVVIVAAMLAVEACGGGSGSGTNGGGTFTTTVPASKGLNTLTAGETATLCMDLGKAFTGADISQGACKFAAFFFTALSADDSSITDAQLQSMCMQSYNACVQQGQTSDGGADMCMAPGPTCTATVAELSACVKEARDGLVASFAAIPSCSSLTKASLATAAVDAGPPDPMSGPACATLKAKCPDSMVGP